jgi:hypothetical protein
MQMPTEIALWIQEILLGLDGEEWGITYVTCRMSAIGKDDLERWQYSVDFIYRMLICDLMDVHGFMECHDKPSLLDEIRKVSPFEDLGGFLWNGTQIHGTKRLDAMIRSYFPPPEQHDRKLNPAFVEALEAIFAENGVAWSDTPLLPIRPNAGAAATAPT